MTQHYFYKTQSEEQKLLDVQDFLLCLQTRFQKEMLYHSKMMCIDFTYKTTEQDFYLTSILVIDDYEEAIPVAWAISNREDADIMEIFFKH